MKLICPNFAQKPAKARLGGIKARQIGCNACATALRPTATALNRTFHNFSRHEKTSSLPGVMSRAVGERGGKIHFTPSLCGPHSAAPKTRPSGCKATHSLLIRRCAGGTRKAGTFATLNPAHPPDGS